MKVLIVSATEKEVNLLLQKTSDLKKNNQWLFTGVWGKLKLDFLISGLGLPSTIFRLTHLLSKNQYDLAINIGIAGSFSESIRIGSVVNVVSQQFGDLGVDDQGEFHTLFDLGYIDKNSNPFVGGVLVNSFERDKYEFLHTVPSVSGITVNKASGEQDDIVKKWIKFQPDVENMEGAGFFYVCLLLGLPFLEIKAISNKVEPRNTKNWNIPQALITLADHIEFLLKEIDTKA